jgi:phospholipid-transporting ATPase
MPNNKILLMCKGADNIIYERLSSSSEYKNETQEFLLDCAQEGLRTLVLAEKEIPEDEYIQWNKKYQEASREVNGRNNRMEKVAELIEQDLFLLGATAIEDKLQDKVGDSIEFIKRAGIHFWVLTGDKMETAINIAVSSKLLTTNSTQSIVSSREKWEVKQELQKLKEVIETSSASALSNLALIITGDALLSVVEDKKMEVMFIQISRKVQTVIGCRVSPKQKAEIVNLIKAYDSDAVTLAIGDGANDVNMIAAAHVGVGIRGLEGQQAARASDYAITKFQHLKNLLFAHGREATRRNGFTICYFFYKNALLIIPSTLYALLSAGSAQSLYNDWLYQLFNTLFTTVPIVCFA